MEKDMSTPQVVFHFTIDEDDDFCLDIGSEFLATGNTDAEARQNAIQILQKATLTWVGTYAANGVRGDYSHAWYFIRDAAIQAIQEMCDNFSYGGNQTIEFWKGEIV